MTLVLRAPGSLTDATGLPTLPDPYSDLVFGFDADTLDLANGESLTSWIAESGSLEGLTLTPSGVAPVMDKTTLAGGKACVKFTAGGLVTPASSLALGAGTTYAIGVRIREALSPAAQQQIMSGHNTGGYHRISTGSAGDSVLGAASSSSELPSIASPLGEWSLLFLEVDGANSLMERWHNGAKTLVTGTMSANIQSRLRLGVNSAGTGGYPHGEMIRAYAWSRKLTAEDREQFYHDTKARYGGI